MGAVSQTKFSTAFFGIKMFVFCKISLSFVPKVIFNNIPTLVQVIVWRRSVDKPLSEPMMVRLPTHICVTRPQWIRQKQGTRYLTTFLPVTNIITTCIPDCVRPILRHDNSDHYAHLKGYRGFMVSIATLTLTIKIFHKQYGLDYG